MADNPSQRWSRRFAALAAGIVLGLATAELLVAIAVSHPGAGIHFSARPLACCQLDAQLIWTFRPGVSGTWGTDEFQERSSINALGMRDDEIEAKRPDEWRIVAIGDSFTYGHGVQLDESYPKVVERLLAARGAGAGSTVHVLNAGQPGYGIDQTYKSFVLRRLELEPDVVLVGLHSTDVTIDVDKSLFTLRDGGLVELDARRNWIYVQGAILSHIPQWLSRSRLLRLGLSALQQVPTLRQTPPLAEPELYAWQRDKAVAEIAALQELGRARGFRVAVVLMPSDWALRDPSWRPFADLAPRLRALGIPALDLLRGLGSRSADPAALFFPKDKHLNVAGNRVLGELVAEFLTGAGLAGRPGGA